MATAGIVASLASILLLSAGPSLCAQDPPLAERVVGAWLVRTAEFEMRVDIARDGTFERVTRVGEDRESGRGTWKLEGKVMLVKEVGEDETLRFTVKMPDANTLELTEGDQTGYRFVRQGQAPPVPAKPPQDPPPITRPRDAGADVTRSPSERPVLAEGWSAFEHPMIGVQAQIPPGWWARMQGGLMFSVEKQAAAGTMAFVVPMRPRRDASVAKIAEQFVALATRAEPKFHSKVIATDTDRVLAEFTSAHHGKPVEGRICTVVSAGGSMAFVIGVMAPQGELTRELPTLTRIAQGFGFVPPRGRFIPFRSPAGGFTLTLPQGWQVQSSDGRSPKDDIDWVAFDPQTPSTRAFQWVPRVCHPMLMQDPMHAMRGYRPGGFADHKEAVVASLTEIAQGVKLHHMQINEPLTALFRALQRDVAGLLGAMGAAQVDIVVYDCLAEAKLDGQPVLVAFLSTLQTMAIQTGMGAAMDWRITLRGWCAAPADFLNDTPVLEKVSASMQLSPAFLRRITEGNQQAAAKIQQTYAHMNEVDRQIRDEHWDTMDAVAEMNYDTLREHGGYVNEETGRIEQIPTEGLVKNSSGELVSREEFQRGVPLEQCTVLREAYSDDYMKGAYGRIEFTPW